MVTFLLLGGLRLIILWRFISSMALNRLTLTAVVAVRATFSGELTKKFAARLLLVLVLIIRMAMSCSFDDLAARVGHVGAIIVRFGGRGRGFYDHAMVRSGRISCCNAVSRPILLLDSSLACGLISMVWRLCMLFVVGLLLLVRADH